MKKGDLTCSIEMAKLLSTVPEDAEIGSVAIFVGVKGSGVYMGSYMDANPEQIASMISAISEAKSSLMDGIVRVHGMETMVSVLFFLASSTASTKDLGSDPFDSFKKYFIPKSEKEG
jgi:L-asparaginase/Glu-tRNA(Gln) amidotransferase subunit D